MMHRLLNILLFSFFVIVHAVAQTPQSIYYQSVVRNASGNLVQNTPVSFRFTIHDVIPTGSIAYQQTDTVVADQMGLITVVLGGGGSIVQGNFGVINWAVGSKYLEVELDAAGGTNYINMGTTQMLSVPYALYAASAGSAANADTAWATTGPNIHNTNPGNVGINNPTPTAPLDVNGSSKLGPGAPPTRMKEYSGTLPLTAGGTNSFNTGIPDSSILSVSTMVLDPVGGLIAPFNTLAGEEYHYTIIGSVFTMITTLTNSVAILGKPYRTLIIYKQ